MEQSKPDVSDTRHLINVEQSLEELQSRVGEYQQELSELQQTGEPANPALSHSARAPFEVMTTAFNDVSQDAPFMPSQLSVLPALLALRKAHQTITESKAYLASQTTSVDTTRRQVDTEKANLEDQRQLTTSLEKRIQSLKHDLEDQMDLDPGQIARQRLDELRRKTKHYDRETTRLLRDLNRFIDEHLAAQLAAEDLGGLVVGDNLRVDEDDIAAGFNPQGRSKKKQASAKPDDDGKRQRRLEEVWGPAFAERERDDVPDETAAAGHELRDLTEELLNRLVESGGDSSAAYVQLPKETAASRFLVRSKVAQFHPRDATRIKLIDFGKELED